MCLSGNVYMNMQVMTMFNLTNFRKKNDKEHKLHYSFCADLEKKIKVTKT